MQDSKRFYHSTASVYAAPATTQLQPRRDPTGMVGRKKVVERRSSPAFIAMQPLTPRSADPSWFFPVGSTVVHKSFGRGTVLPSENGNMDIAVEFANGKKQNFPLNGTDITPVLG
jgi:hypothetical protein